MLRSILVSLTSEGEKGIHKATKRSVTEKKPSPTFIHLSTIYFFLLYIDVWRQAHSKCLPLSARAEHTVSCNDWFRRKTSHSDRQREESMREPENYRSVEKERGRKRKRRKSYSRMIRYHFLGFLALFCLSCDHRLVSSFSLLIRQIFSLRSSFSFLSLVQVRTVTRQIISSGGGGGGGGGGISQARDRLKIAKTSICFLLSPFLSVAAVAAATTSTFSCVPYHFYLNKTKPVCFWMRVCVPRRWDWFNVCF